MLAWVHHKDVVDNFCAGDEPEVVMQACLQITAPGEEEIQMADEKNQEKAVMSEKNNMQIVKENVPWLERYRVSSGSGVSARPLTLENAD